MANEVVIHVKAKDHTKGDFAGIEKNANALGGRMRRSFDKIGANSAGAFAAGFIKTITFGQVGSGFAQASMKLAPHAAKAGGILGVTLGAALIMELATALSAGLPLLMGGALLAGPLMYLWKTQTEAVDRLKSRAKDFIEYISKPLEIPFTKSLEAVGDGLERIGKPLRNMLAGLAPALEPFTKGVMKGIEAFVLAIEPAIPSIAAGMTAWGEAAPKIGKAMGDFLAKIMDNPEDVVQAVQDLADGLVSLANAAGNVISVLQEVAEQYQRFGNAFKVGGNIGQMLADGIIRGAAVARSAGSRISAAFSSIMSRVRSVVSSGASAVVSRFRSLMSSARSAVSSGASAIASRFRSLMSSARSAVSSGASAVASRFRSMMSSARSAVSSGASAIASRMRAAMNSLVSAVRSGASRAVAAFTSLRSRIRGVFAGAGSWLVGAGRALISGLISGIRAAAGAAAAAARSVVQRAAAAARAAIPGLATGGIVGGLSHAAEGGPRGGAVLVGEHGPEIVNLPLGSHVNSNPDSRRMMAGKGGRGDTHFHFHGPVYGDHNALRRALVNMKRSGELDVVLR